MNSADTINARMQKAGLPYEVTNSETPEFILSGCSHGREVAVVALWKDSLNDNTEAYVGYYGEDTAEAVALRAKQVRGCYATYVVKAQGF